MTGRRRFLSAAMLVVVALVAGCGSSSRSISEVRAYLDGAYADDADRSDTWRSASPVEQTADRIDEELDPSDRFTEQQATFMRDGDYIVAVFPDDGTGSRVELDTHERMHSRYPLLIGGFWGRFPGSYGPRGERASRTGGGFRGGGPGFGK